MSRPATMALIELILITRPPWPRLSIAPPMILVQRKVLVRLRSISSCQRASGISVVGAGSRLPPILLIRMSIGPCSATTRLGRGFAGSRAGRCRPRARAPRGRSGAACRPRPPGSSGRGRRARDRRRLRPGAVAMARPSPRLPPVMKARLPSRRKRSSTVMRAISCCSRQCRGLDLLTPAVGAAPARCRPAPAPGTRHGRGGTARRAAPPRAGRPRSG